MIGVIVCGNGYFNEGLRSALKLLVGVPEKIEYVDYKQEDTADEFENRLKAAIYAFEEKDILILCDMAQETPYFMAVSCKNKIDDRNIEVVTGVNVGMLVQINLARGYLSAVDDLADFAVEEGKKQISVVRSEDYIPPTDEEEE